MAVTKIFGHRGSPHEAPENTLAGIEAAARHGVDGVEVDLRLAADGAVVVIHDETLERTTAGHGPVRQQTAAALAALGVPRIEEVVQLAADLGLALNLEVKEPDPAIAAAVAALTLPEGSGVSSFLLVALDHVAAAAPELPRSFLSISGGLDEAGAHHGWNPFFRSVLDGPQAVATAHERGLAVAVWTVDEPEDIAAVAALGVDAVITNHPGRAVAVLRR